MAITATTYGQTFTGQYSATAARRIDFATDTIKCALTTSAYTPNRDTHVFFSDVTNEITGTAYVAGGATVSGKSVSYDSATHETRLLAAAVSWAASTLTARRAVFYKDTGTAATSPLISWIDFGGDETTSSATFTVTPDATNGITKVAAA